ncbi:ABC transporter substrate-binding protein [Acidisphaera sp. S103]|uniref:ABC transporter substrate-binding protein n=1 Tax=Acidisphaera sp. S103 TaxID=1747223 RepID=UPI00131A7D96|nr:extracellular solute-binding protein [Acidisphaera sp. S103]
MSQKMTRRHAAAGLAALVVTPKPGEAAADNTALEAMARGDGTVTWYIAQVDAQTAENLGRSFSQRYPGVNVGVIRTTGQVAYQRLLMDIKNHVPQCDVFSTTDISHMPILKERHELAEYTVANADALLPAFKALSDPGYSYITNAARYFLIYNKDRVKPEDVPRAWTDLLDPKWKGRVATGHPAFSGCTGTWALGVKKVHGWDFFEKLAKNNPRIGRSAVDPMTLITAGECLVGVGSANNAYASIDKGNPIGVVHPSDGLVLCVTPSAIPANAPHPHAGRLFMEWLLSPEYARLIAADGSEPILVGVPPRSGMPPLADQKIISLTVDEIRTGVPRVIEQWRDTFGS